MIARILLILLAIACLLNLWLMPTNKYEWMLEEGMTSLPEDGNGGFYKSLTLFPILLFAGLALLFLKNKRKDLYIALATGAILLLLWTLKFWL